MLGELGPRLARAFVGMDVVAADGETTVTTPVTDQPHLLGLLMRVGDLGLAIRSVTALDVGRSPISPR